jgi:hypothetical protein
MSESIPPQKPGQTLGNSPHRRVETRLAASCFSAPSRFQHPLLSRRHVIADAASRVSTPHIGFMTPHKNAYRVETARLRDWDRRSPAWYFVTICTNAHRCRLGEISNGKIDLSVAGQIAETELERMPTRYSNVCLDAYVIMPNHVHATVILEDHHQFIPDAMARNDPQQGTHPSCRVSLHCRMSWVHIKQV